ncbi:MAG: hypothetical protein JWN95_3322 [Frankiales bacterium]|nr:hypothetical protein [Frankiales bacterium]
MDTDQLGVKLLLLLDSRSPAGAHSHSFGMESAVTAGYVSSTAEVAEFCQARLVTSGIVSAAFAATACRLWLSNAADSDARADADAEALARAGAEAEAPADAAAAAAAWAALDTELSARTPSEATRAASRSLGGGLARLLLATVPTAAADLRTRWARCPRPAPHHPLVLGAAIAICGGSPRLAARAAALGTCSGPASAAVRLLGLDPYAVHRVLFDLSDEIEQVAEAATMTGPEALPAWSAPAIDLLADHHSRMEARLFAS